MKKIIILSILFTLILAGVIFATYEYTDEVEIARVEEVLMHQLPDPMLDVIMDPVTGFSLF